MPASPRLLIADDEPALAENLVAELAALWPEATLLPAVHDGQSALDVVDDAAQGQAPDVVFLDIRMPGLSGIDVARELSQRDVRPLVVFVTAYDQFALDAFEQAAVDYVLKPVQTERLAETVKRLKDRLGTRPNGNASAAATDPAQTLAELVERLAGLQGAAQTRATPQGGYLRFIKALVGQEVRFIPVDDVIYLEATDKYVNVVSASGESLIRTSLRDLLTQLDPEHFWQVHRGTVVNVAHVSSAVHLSLGRLGLKIRGRTETLPVARQYAHLFRQM
ncbi:MULTISPECIES: LytTR family DNA-binding domain-containing protein [Ralstonia]|jgi:DNA-binding LytR/AlgR family response regulator|uniref:Two component transcriptional regulator, LytTR family n=1 Tax=Ralstonia pickettii OR214 TaxID=1264675 RepID=R0CTK3_RALPI|nr:MULTISPECIES: LytTR family DNA-binding domain-containing protein [Ralstonia]MEA3269301.1 LytTR family DNA-binding domain-containing protein [Pseudomonadota bacterium]ENZ79886.1 two component transcriptional regulator, LytTR family [Ralstonia pickettii OR214]MCM3582235.1 LytTR family DNA-binding domain-containing protein [Ralstonia pickettii]MDH6642644.1 DNA-binding LytR/AlgR family response regulator [Ralstonia sp. GP73]MDR9383105.1 LytTR family DNA-binding domain-containing protein [Ralsto